jgi:NTE family protein
MKKIGLALGGGGAKGLAHIPMLEVFDELGIRPHRISGTSIGAVIGALYASGKSAADIRELVRRMVVSQGRTFREALTREGALKLLEFVDIDFAHHGLVKGDKFIQFLYDAMGVSTFEQLKIPLCVVTTDFWKSEEVVHCSGALLPAVKASMGLPGVFAPVEMGGRVLIDGGGVNPVPHDLLQKDCDAVVAIDVMGDMTRGRETQPNLFRAVIGMFDIMQKSIVAEKMKNRAPDVYIKPEISGVDILEFYKADQVYEQAGPAKDKLRLELEKLK